MFDSTCAFSRVAIAKGDPVLLVAIAPSFAGVWDTCDLNTRVAVSKQAGTPPLRSLFRRVEIGAYNGYGSVEGFDPDEGFTEDEEGLGCSCLFMVHLPVVLSLLDETISPNLNLMNATCKLIRIAYDLRVQLNTGLLGSQTATEKEVEGQLELLKATSALLEEKRQKLELRRKLFGG